MFLRSHFLGILIKNANGRANNTLAILDPTMFPRVIPSQPLIAECTEMANSGAEVPNATNVKAITKGFTFICLAKEVEPSTSQSPLKYSKEIPSAR